MSRGVRTVNVSLVALVMWLVLSQLVAVADDGPNSNGDLFGATIHVRFPRRDSLHLDPHQWLPRMPLAALEVPMEGLPLLVEQRWVDAGSLKRLRDLVNRESAYGIRIRVGAMRAKHLRVLKSCPTLRRLELRDVVDFADLAAELITWSGLRELSIAGERLQPSPVRSATTLLTALSAVKHDISVLELRGVHLCGAGIRELRKWVSLEEVTIQSIYWDNVEEDMSAFDDLAATNLRKVTLRGQEFDDDALQFLSNVSELEYVDLRGTALGDETVGKLARTAVRVLRVGGGAANVSSKGLWTLRASGLVALDLNLCDWIDDAELGRLSHVTTLEELSVGSLEVEGSGLRRLSSLAHLEHLSLEGCTNLRSSQALYVRELKNLKSLRLPSRSVSRSVREELRASLPDCWIP